MFDACRYKILTTQTYTVVMWQYLYIPFNYGPELENIQKYILSYVVTERIVGAPDYPAS